jgi:hypothetical protein
VEQRRLQFEDDDAGPILRLIRLKSEEKLMSNRRVFSLIAVAALAVACVSADALAAVAVRGGAVAVRGRGAAYRGGAVAVRGGAVGYRGGAVAYRGGAVVRR